MADFVDHQQVEAGADWVRLIDQLRDWFSAGRAVAPSRQVLQIAQPDGSDASLLVMPAWVPGVAIRVKVVTFFPSNAARGLPTINAGYLFFDGETGQMRTVLDGDALTARRTAAASALAADYLARADAQSLLVLGTGQLSSAMIEAHATVREHRTVMLWGRNVQKAQDIAASFACKGFDIRVEPDLEGACAKADVVSTVTESTEPLIKGAWLRPGTHLDLVGGFKSDMRESDDQCIAQASVFVDGRDGAGLCGDIAQPLETGAIKPNHILSDLADLCVGRHQGRRDTAEFTVFKSAGLAVEDLAAASLIANHSNPQRKTNDTETS